MTPTFNGSRFDIGTLMFDHDGNLWVGTVAKGLFRIHGNAVEHYDHTNGLSGEKTRELCLKERHYSPSETERTDSPKRIVPPLYGLSRR